MTNNRLIAVTAVLGLTLTCSAFARGPERPQRPEKIEKPGLLLAKGGTEDKPKPEKPQKPEKPGVTLAKGGRPEDNPKGQRPQRPQRPERPEKVEKIG